MRLIYLLFFFILTGIVWAQPIPDAASDNTLKIVDINVWSGLNYEGIWQMGEYEPVEIREQRYQSLISQLKALDADIIGLHEANPLPDYADRIARDLGMVGIYHIGLGGIRIGALGLPLNLREGDVILAKPALQPTFAGRKQLSGGFVGNTVSFHTSDATQIIAMKITFRNRDFYIFATHWHASPPGSAEVLLQLRKLQSSGDYDREDHSDAVNKVREGVEWRISEAKQTLEFIESVAGDNAFILMGDFNAPPTSREIQLLKALPMIDAYEEIHSENHGYTWHPAENEHYRLHYQSETGFDNAFSLFENLQRWAKQLPNRIDYIFLGPEKLYNLGQLKLINSRIVLDKPVNGIQPSDHFGIYAEIVVP